jgi:hypothetical protein
VLIVSCHVLGIKGTSTVSLDTFRQLFKKVQDDLMSGAMNVSRRLASSYRSVAV